MRYKCYFCDYTTDIRSQIHKHHITPQEIGGRNNKDSNVLFLCPNHHSQVYEPSSIHGIHSKKGCKSIQIICWRFSSMGRLLEYIDETGKTLFK